MNNAGPGGTIETSWTDEVFLSPVPVLGTNALLLGSFAHDGILANGQSYHVSASIFLPASLSGTYYLLVRTDARSNVFEHVFESNNVTASTSPIVISLTPPPDLAVGGVATAATALASHALTVSYSVTNQGTGTLFTYLWEDRLYLSTNHLTPALSPSGGEGVVYLGSDWHFGGLLASESYTYTFDVVLPDNLSGAYYASWRPIRQLISLNW